MLNIYSNGTFLELWARDEKYAYIVGQLGTLIHYDGSSLTQLDAGTQYDINDVWGVADTVVSIASTWLFDATPTRIIRTVGLRSDNNLENGIPRAMKIPKPNPRVRSLGRRGKVMRKYSKSAPTVTRKTKSEKSAVEPQPITRTKRGMATRAVPTLEMICAFTGHYARCLWVGRSARPSGQISSDAFGTL